MSTDATGGLLAGKVAVVTGATSGSGRAIARRFADEGARVFLLARGPERLKELEGAIGKGSVGMVVDVGDADAVRTAFAQIGDDEGRLDILVNNAALYRPCPIESLTDDEISLQVRTNFLGPVHTCRAAIPLMRAAGCGDIVNTSSETTLDPFPHLSMYSATKAALEMFTRTLAIELGDEDIRVTNLVQGVAFGEGGGSSGWSWDPELAEQATALWEERGYLRRVGGTRGGQSVESIAEVHVFIVTRPRGQKLDTIFCRAY
jgi:NAD(P)-dependent dehydrogenase (short-subunit alcohol dehydrogenase family)